MNLLERLNLMELLTLRFPETQFSNREKNIISTMFSWPTKNLTTPKQVSNLIFTWLPSLPLQFSLLSTGLICLPYFCHIELN